jgi:shikimate kinase
MSRTHLTKNMSNNPPIILTGFMGSGKTTVAEVLAHVLSRSVIDLDQVIMASNARTPREIILQDGEDAFREIETQSLHNVLKNGSGHVIALGGGAWTLQRNRDLINEHRGITVWLDAPFQLCWGRILATRDKHPLAPDQVQARILYLERRPHYALAQVHVEVDGYKSIDEISAEIAEALQVRTDSSGPRNK